MMEDLEEVENVPTIEIDPPPSVPEEAEDISDYERKEAELFAYLDKMNEPEPPKNKLELLKTLPNYEEIMKKKPGMKRVQNDDDFIDFDEKPSKNVSSSCGGPLNGGVQTLLNKYIKHTNFNKNKPVAKEAHYPVNILKKEENSEGITNFMVEENDFKTIEEDSQLFSDKDVVPGATYCRLKTDLLARINEKKGAKLEEQEKLHAMYSEERDLENEDQEEILDEDYNFSDDEGEENDEIDIDDEKGEEGDAEESEGEDIGDDQVEEEESENEGEITVIENKNYNGNSDSDEDMPRKVSKKKFVFIEDEASEDSDEGKGTSSTKIIDDESEIVKQIEKEEKLIDDSFINDNPTTSEESDDNDSDTESGREERRKLKRIESNVFMKSIIEAGNNNDSSQNNNDSLSLPVPNNDNNNDSEEKGLNSFNATPIPDEVRRLMATLKATPPKITKSLKVSKAKDGQENKSNTPTPYQIDLDDCSDICSGHFPTQPPMTPEESQSTSNFPLNDSVGFDESDNVSMISANEVPSAKLSQDFNSEEIGKIHIFDDSESDCMMDSQKSTQVDDVDVEGSKEETLKSPTISSKAEAMNSDVNELKSGESGLFSQVTPPPRKSMHKRRRILEFSDDENDDNIPKVKEHSQKKKLNNSLGFNVEVEEDSDSSDDENANAQNQFAQLKNYYDLPDEEKKGGKKGGLVSAKTGKLRKEFFENEAELSGSEVGSGDEDERGLDEFEEEEGDKEEINEDELRDQVGRAHLKQILDDDQRELRYLKDVFMEDAEFGDRDGKGRERTFKWKGLNDWGEDEEGQQENELNGHLDYEEENKRMLEKAEKLKWIKDNAELYRNDAENDIDSQEAFRKFSNNWSFGGNKPSTSTSSLSFSKTKSFFNPNDISNNSFSNHNHNSKTNNTNIHSHSEPITFENAGAAAGKAGHFDELSNSKTNFSQSLFLSPDKKAKFHGSFLSRGTPALTRLAEMTKISDTISNVKNNSRGFTFNAITPPEKPIAAGSSSKRKTKIPVRNNKPTKKVKVEASSKNVKALNEHSQSSSSLIEFFK